MKRVVIVALVLIALAAYAERALLAQSGQSMARQERLAKQVAFENATPKLEIKEEVLSLVVPGETIGETVGVAKNSQGHLLVLTRTGNAGPARGATASRLFEFDTSYQFVKEWGPNNYAASFAHTVRVDKHDNVWMVDEGSGMIVKFNPDATVAMVLGRKPESIDYMEEFIEFGEKLEERHPVGTMGRFNRQTDVTWDTEDNIFVSDGYGNSRVVKITKDGTWVKALGTYGDGPNQFDTPHAITADAEGNIYVADRGNWRIQKFDSDLNLIKVITNIRAPWSVCVTPGPTPYLYSGDSGGNIYKMDLDGNVLGWGETSQGHGQSGCLVHELHCESENVIYKGDCSAWLVEKLTISSGAAVK